MKSFRRFIYESKLNTSAAEGSNFSTGTNPVVPISKAALASKGTGLGFDNIPVEAIPQLLNHPEARPGDTLLHIVNKIAAAEVRKNTKQVLKQWGMEADVPVITISPADSYREVAMKATQYQQQTLELLDKKRQEILGRLWDSDGLDVKNAPPPDSMVGDGFGEFEVKPNKFSKSGEAITISQMPPPPENRSNDDEAGTGDDYVNPGWPPENSPDWYKEQWKDDSPQYWNSNPRFPLVPTLPGGPVIPTFPLMPNNPMHERPTVKPWKDDDGEWNNHPLWPVDDPRWNQHWKPSEGDPVPPGWPQEGENPDGVDPLTEPHWWDYCPACPSRWVPRRPGTDGPTNVAPGRPGGPMMPAGTPSPSNYWDTNEPDSPIGRNN